MTFSDFEEGKFCWYIARCVLVKPIVRNRVGNL